MRVLNPISSPFEWLSFVDSDSNILSVVLPTFIDVVYLSPEIELCPSLYRNPGSWEQEAHHRIRLFKWLRLATQETPVQTENDLADLGHKEMDYVE